MLLLLVPCHELCPHSKQNRTEPNRGSKTVIWTEPWHWCIVTPLLSMLISLTWFCVLIHTLKPLLSSCVTHVLWVAQVAKPHVTSPEPFQSWVRILCGKFKIETLKLYIRLSFKSLLSLHCCWWLNAIVLDVHLHVYSICAVFILAAPHCYSNNTLVIKVSYKVLKAKYF